MSRQKQMGGISRPEFIQVRSQMASTDYQKYRWKDSWQQVTTVYDRSRKLTDEVRD